ncbi:PD-(D/E)XK motif protein [Kitasatospora sp. GP82]|uniref:PD-(D/E)XK motif protein n=1 Tax=Kitasatospora sp. GP82 TaxID=3035089 RepID=UPI0024746AB5|nr:PD-(D/E)XK motif protein [Kitasatospora sp. GP82]MDH6123636.1 hypothetical protein [Kitasatospora sp. GP82]
MIVTEELWHDLEEPQAAPGRSIRRVYPESGRNLFLTVNHPGMQRALVLSVDAHAGEGAVRALGRLAPTAGLELSISAATRSVYELHVSLVADELREVFSPLVADIADAARQAGSDQKAMIAAINRFARWQHLLRSISKEGLGTRARRGLVGELFVLRDILLPALTGDEAVEAWTGPIEAHQDFQLADLAIEVKTNTSKAGNLVEISSERQLDPTGIPRLLLAVATLDERRGGIGESLNSLVDSTRERLSTGSAQAHLDDALIRAGYLPGHREHYLEPRYTQRHLRFWDIGVDFPRIIEASLPPGVHDCSYHLDLAGLDKFLVTQEWVAELLGS